MKCILIKFLGLYIPFLIMKDGNDEQPAELPSRFSIIKVITRPERS